MKNPSILITKECIATNKVEIADNVVNPNARELSKSWMKMNRMIRMSIWWESICYIEQCSYLLDRAFCRAGAISGNTCVEIGHDTYQVHTY